MEEGITRLGHLLNVTLQRLFHFAGRRMRALQQEEMQMRKFLGIVGAIAMTAVASADIWTEVGDAPDSPSPGQMTVGVGPLTDIFGTLGDGIVVPDVDMYCVRITSASTFGAIVDSADFDSQMFMFDVSGMGVNHNDDNVGLFSGLYSLGPGAGTPAPIPLVDGAVYGLAISSYNVDPVDPAGGFMWSNSPFGDQTAPDLSPGPLSGWSGDGTGGDYHIRLIGATFCEVPEPASLSLLALGGLIFIRRR